LIAILCSEFYQLKMQTRSQHVILGFILLVIVVLVMMDQTQAAVGKKATPNKQKPVTKTKTATQTATTTTKQTSDASSLRITQLENQVASLRNELKQTQENFRKNKDEMVKIVYSLIEIVKGKKSASPSSAPEATVETKNQPTVPSAKPEQKATTPSTNVKPAEKKVDSKKAKKTKKELDDLDDFDI